MPCTVRPYQEGCVTSSPDFRPGRRDTEVDTEGDTEVTFPAWSQPSWSHRKTFRMVAPKLFAWSLPPKNRLDARWGAADGPRIQVAFPKNRLDASGWAAGGPRIAFLPPKLFTWSQPYRKNRLDASGGGADGPRIAFPDYSSTGFYSSTRVFEYSSTEAGRVATQTRRIAREPIRQYM